MSGVRVGIESAGQRRPIPAGIDLAAFRIVQEALTNTVRHSAASRCVVRIDYRDAELLVEISGDQGRAGADPHDVRP